MGIKLSLTNQKGPISISRRKSKMSDEFIKEEILKPIEHFRRTHKGETLIDTTVIKIAEFHNMGKRYPYNSAKRGWKQDFIISI